MAAEEWMHILNKVKNGEMSVEEAARNLAVFDNITGEASQPVGERSQPGFSEPQDMLGGMGWQKFAWMIPLGIGIVIVVSGAWLLSWGYANEHFFWFYCSWLPLLLGILILVLGVWSRQARWAHIRVHGHDGTNIAISVPLPIRLASWGLRTFGSRIPDLKEKHLDDLPVILDGLSSSSDPISVEVDDKNGEQVRVYIL